MPFVWNMKQKRYKTCSRRFYWLKQVSSMWKIFGMKLWEINVELTTTKFGGFGSLGGRILFPIPNFFFGLKILIWSIINYICLRKLEKCFTWHVSKVVKRPYFGCRADNNQILSMKGWYFQLSSILFLLATMRGIV